MRARLEDLEDLEDSEDLESRSVCHGISARVIGSERAFIVGRR